MTGANVLELCSVAVGYGAVPVVRDVDVVVHAGEVVAVLGANGAGKTTLVHTIAGVIPPVAGSLWFNGKPLRGPLHSRARGGIALVTEERAVIRGLTVRENLILSTRNPEDVLSLFPQLRIFLNKKAGLLSGGEQQMLVLGRVFASRPRLVLVDEMSFGLAPLIVRQLLAVLRDAADRGLAVMVVEQHPALALSIADHGYVLGQGRVQLKGSGADLLADLDQIERTYLAGVTETEETS